MRRLVSCLGLLVLLAAAPPARAEVGDDPIGDLIVKALAMVTIPQVPDWRLKATLYHAGAHGVGPIDSLGCKTVPMRTAAIDKKLIPRRTVLFIKETVGLPMPNGATHDGYWYASDVGGAIKGERIDLYTGNGRGSMKPLMPYNLKKLSVSKVGEFEGCPPSD